MSYNHYISDVLSGKVVTGELVRYSVQRHLNDLNRQRTESFPYYFDESVAKRWVNFASLCRQWKGTTARQRIDLQPWQQFYISELFGWQRVSGGRRFRTAYLEIGRKNGKTTLCAIKALGHIVLDNEPGAQVYIAATKEEQARIAFKDVQEIIKATPGLHDKFRLYVKSVVSGSSFIKPLGSDSDTQDGFDPSYGIVDEYHAHPTSGMLNVIESGMGARFQPLIDIITTAGFNRMNPCYAETRKASIEVLKGIKHDETHMALIYTLDDGDDWKDEANWIKANPNLNVSVRMDFLRDRLVKAINEGGSKEVDFKTKNLNIWTDALSVWIPDERWNRCSEEFTIEDCEGMPCYFALDLASTMDTTSLALIFVDGSRYRVINEYFIPEETISKRSEKDGVMYKQWARDGLMTVTPGNVTDYDFIRARLNELKTRVSFVRGAYDDWNSSDLIPRLIDDGFEMEPMTQSIKAMSTPTKEFEKMVYMGKIIHNGHPVTRWQMSNVMIKRDANENYKIAKDKSAEKVDGPVSIVMAVALIMKYGTEETVYEVELW
jgi:phage terminase large subunit-like protein